MHCERCQKALDKESAMNDFFKQFVRRREGAHLTEQRFALTFGEKFGEIGLNWAEVLNLALQRFRAEGSEMVLLRNGPPSCVPDRGWEGWELILTGR